MYNEPNPLLIVLSGPSGVGKDALILRMKELGHDFFYAITATTRPQRSTEVDGEDYYFVGRERFEGMREEGELLEWAEVYGHLYGVPKQPVRDVLREGRDVMVKVDVQGVDNIKRIAPEAVAIFVSPPSMEELHRRLRQRKTESAEALERRIREADEEIQRLPDFDYVVVSHTGDMDTTISQISSIVTAEKCRTKQRRVEL
ncbi:MAG: guanylate kinase [Chloroflexota bacterium]